MNQKKFLAYCPNCNNYDEAAGACSYIHENVFQYPEKFIEYCDGKYLSLIKGKKIGVVNETEIDSNDDALDEEHTMLVPVFNSTDNLSFLMAKSSLKLNGIKFWSNGEFIPPNIIIQSAYPYKIKVFKKDEKAAQKILNELKPSVNQVASTNESDKKEYSFIARWGIIIIIFLIAVLIFLISKY
ncbi:MAG: hypothetical protein ABI840_09335 [bacterium]